MLTPVLQSAARLLKTLLRGGWRFTLTRHNAPPVFITVQQRWPIVLTLILVILEIVRPARLWIVLLAGILAVIILTAWSAIQTARGIRLDRRLLHTWVQVGDLLEEHLILTNGSLFPILAAEVEDQSDVPGYASPAVRAIPAHGSTRWRQTGRSSRRGLFHLGPTGLRFTDLMGFVEIETHDPTQREVLVMPPVLPSIEVRLTPGIGAGSAAARQRSLAETAASSSVRDYHPGDPVRRIHWRRSAQHQRLLIKEFDREMGGDVWLLLDLDAAVHSGTGDDSTIEDGVVWAASWAWHLIRQGKAVGLFAYGPDRLLIRPGRGSAHLWQVLRGLAPVEAQTVMPVEGLIEEITPYVLRGDSLVVITPSLSARWVEELARPTLRAVPKAAVLISRSAFQQVSISAGEDVEASTSPSGGGRMYSSGRGIGQPDSLAAMHALLSDLNIPVTIADPRTRLDAAPAVQGTGDWDFITTPTGRVIVRGRPAEVKS